MNIELEPTKLVIHKSRGSAPVLNIAFLQPLNETDIRRQRKRFNAADRTESREHENQLVLRGVESFLESYFATGTQADSQYGSIRPLSGLTISLLIAGRRLRELGEFGREMYLRALRQLQTAGRFKHPVAGYHGLEEIFSGQISELIRPMALERIRRDKFDQIDEAFFLLTTGTPPSFSQEELATGSACSLPHLPRSSVAAEPALQLDLPFDGEQRLAALSRGIECFGVIIQTPVFVKTFARREFQDVKNKEISAAQRASRKAYARRSGSYIDFTNKLRGVPTLSPATIKGIALAPDVLDSNVRARDLNYLQIAIAASRYRCSNRLGGRNIIAESAEFHVRIVLAIELTPTDAHEFTGEQLKTLVNKAIILYAIDTDAESIAA